MHAIGHGINCIHHPYLCEEMLITILHSYELAYEYGEILYKSVFRLPVLVVLTTRADDSVIVIGCLEVRVTYK